VMLSSRWSLDCRTSVLTVFWGLCW
jgi:hypothetical protein